MRLRRGGRRRRRLACARLVEQRVEPGLQRLVFVALVLQRVLEGVPVRPELLQGRLCLSAERLLLPERLLELERVRGAVRRRRRQRRPSSRSDIPQ